MQCNRVKISVSKILLLQGKYEQCKLFYLRWPLDLNFNQIVFDLYAMRNLLCNYRWQLPGRKKERWKIKYEEHPMDAIHRVTEATAAAAIISGSANDGCKLWLIRVRLSREKKRHQLDSLRIIIFYFTENSLLTSVIYYHLHFIGNKKKNFYNNFIIIIFCIILCHRVKIKNK